MANASYDIYFQIVPENQFTGSKFFSWGQERTLGVRGIQKLVNLFVKYLMTPVGSDPLDLTYGTDLPNLIGSNIELDDAKDILLLAVDKAAKAIQAFQVGADIADDERLATATVTDFIAIPEAPGLAAQIFIENVADQGLTFLLPTLTPRS
jgi:hypothetical protein